MECPCRVRRARAAAKIMAAVPAHAQVLVISRENRELDLILWRHAEAEDGTPDDERRLTGKGHKQAAKIAGWLSEHLPKHATILVSPAARTQQTAKALTGKFATSED